MKLRLIASLAGLLILISSAASAQAPTESAQTETGVARISLIHGDVSTQRGDSGDWAAAALNAPIVAGDRVSTGDRSRAEVQLDYANILRLDERTQANITGLTSTQIQVQVGRGLANYSVLKDSEADVEIDAPNLSVHPRRGDGSYRITVLADDQAEVLVRRGEADISTPQ
ncbi:MAG: FecR domain-containing protein, partial [Terriglobales bacterium]